MILLLLLLLFSPLARAESYIIEKPDGKVDVVDVYTTDGLEQKLEEYGVGSPRIKKVSENDLPADKTDRDAWVFNDSPVGKKVIVDSEIKQQIDDEKQAKADAKQAILDKLGVTEEEAQVISGK